MYKNTTDFYFGIDFRFSKYLNLLVSHFWSSWDIAGIGLRSSQPWWQNPTKILWLLPEEKREKLKLYALEWHILQECRGREDVYWKEDTDDKDLRRPDQTSLHLVDQWTGTDFSSHFHAENHTQQQRCNMSIRHAACEELWWVSVQVLIHPCPYMLRGHPSLLSFFTEHPPTSNLCLGNPPEGSFLPGPPSGSSTSPGKALPETLTRALVSF